MTEALSGTSEVVADKEIVYHHLYRPEDDPIVESETANVEVHQKFKRKKKKKKSPKEQGQLNLSRVVTSRNIEVEVDKSTDFQVLLILWWTISCLKISDTCGS